MKADSRIFPSLRVFINSSVMSDSCIESWKPDITELFIKTRSEGERP
jgi:hypothetical protein